MGDLVKAPPLNNVSSGQESSGIPGFPSQPPPLSTPPSNAGGTAPSFPPPVTGSPANVAPPWPSGRGSDTLSPPPPAVPTPPGSNYPPGVRDPFTAGSSSPPPAAAPPAAENSTAAKIEQTMQRVKLDVEKNRFSEALLNLSQLYGNPDLPMSQVQAREVARILDQLGAKVIYSREHWLDRAYLVQAGDTLDTIADRYQVPALLLAKINGIRDPQNLPPGKELKVLKGPFSAQISPDRSEMTLMLDGRYAGRFNIVLSSDLGHTASLWTVRDKRAATAAPGNGTGRQWIELGNESGTISMQGTNDTRVAASRESRSTIWLSEQDMDDVFGILSVGSRVIIQR